MVLYSLQPGGGAGPTCKCLLPLTLSRKEGSGLGMTAPYLFFSLPTWEPSRLGEVGLKSERKSERSQWLKFCDSAGQPQMFRCCSAWGSSCAQSLINY